MGKYGMTRSQNRYYSQTKDQYQYEVANTPYMRWQLSQAPVAGSFYRASDQEKYYNDYLRNIGKWDKDWTFVKYPALLSGQGYLGAVAGTVPMLSRNLLRMYR